MFYSDLTEDLKKNKDFFKKHYMFFLSSILTISTALSLILYYANSLQITQLASNSNMSEFSLISLFLLAILIVITIFYMIFLKLNSKNKPEVLMSFSIKNNDERQALQNKINDEINTLKINLDNENNETTTKSENKKLLKKFLNEIHEYLKHAHEILTIEEINSYIQSKSITTEIKCEALKEFIKPKPTDPHEYNPLTHALKAIRSIAVWPKKKAKQRPIIFGIFGILYFYPAIILLMHFYGNPNFDPVSNWLLNNLFLPAANGLVAPGHAEWIAALATGFLFAKVFYLLADFLLQIKEKKPAESILAQPFKSLYEQPISSLLGIIGLAILVKVCAGISIFTHLSGSWLAFNLITILIKLVALLYDTFKNNEKSLIAKIFIFPVFLFFYFNRFMKKFSEVFFSGLAEIIFAPFRYLLWPIIRVFLDNITFKKARTIFNKFEDQCLIIFEYIKFLLSRCKILNALLFAGCIYTMIPLINIIATGHILSSSTYSLFNKLLLNLNFNTSIDIACLVCIIACTLPLFLYIYNFKENMAFTTFTSIIAITIVVSLIANISNAHINNIYSTESDFNLSLNNCFGIILVGIGLSYLAYFYKLTSGFYEVHKSYVTNKDKFCSAYPDYFPTTMIYEEKKHEKQGSNERRP